MQIPDITEVKTPHAVLTESYMSYLVLLVPAIIISSYYPISTKLLIFLPLGVFLLMAAPLLIMWAQNSSENFNKIKEKGSLTVADFMHGPYRYLRFPTHMGLFLLIIGLATVMGSWVILIAGLLSQVISHTLFLTKEDKLMVEKYGQPYLDYKKIVRTKI